MVWLTGFMVVQAGRHVELDTLAQKYYTASASARESLYSEALGIVATAGSAAKHYVRVMEKLANGSTGYIEKESKRYVLIGLSVTSTANLSFFFTLIDWRVSYRNASLEPASLMS